MARRLLYILTTLLVLAGCAEKTIQMPDKVGYLVVDISFDDTAYSTKSGEIDLEDFDITISGPDSLSFKCGDMPELLALEPGSYTISVSSPDVQPVAFSQPIYGCTTGFVVKEGETASVKLICTMLNMKVTVNPSSDFKAKVKSYSVTVSNGSGELVWTQEDVEAGKEGYFSVAPLSVNLRGVSWDNVQLSYDGMITDVEASDHHKISFDAF